MQGKQHIEASQGKSNADPKLNRYFVTFGLGSILGKSYLVAYASDETTLRLALNAAKLPWCGCYGVDQFTDAIAKYGLVRLPRDFEATEFNAGPVSREISCDADLIAATPDMLEGGAA